MDWKASAGVLTPSIPYSTIRSADCIQPSPGHSLADSDKTYNLLRQIYTDTVHNTYFLPLVVTGLAFMTTLAIEYKNIRKMDKERERNRK